MPFYPIVIVEWHDAYGDATEQWFEGGDINHEPLTVQTLGYLMRDDSIGVTMWQEMSAPDGSSYRARTFIPRGMIKKVTHLGNKRVKKVKPPKET